MSYKKILACAEHIDLALDDFVDEYEIYPELTKVDEGKCDYCSNKAIYQVTNAD